MTTIGPASQQTLEKLKADMNNDNRTVDTKTRDLEKKNNEIAAKKKELFQLEEQARVIQMDLDRLKQQRTQNEQKIRVMAKDLQDIIKKDKK